MLEFLRIQDLALIENMELEFSGGMNVLTGETGAGKSFILKALNFLLGEKMNAEMIRTGQQKASVEAIFVYNNEELILRRELFAQNGRSRFYINNALSSQECARELHPQLLIHTSQHAQQRLLQSSYQAKLIEESLSDTKLLQERNELLQQLQSVSEKRVALQERHTKLSEKRDLLEMQQQEIDKVAPKQGEEEELESLRATARENSHRVADYAEALNTLYGDSGPGLRDILGSFERTLERILEYDEDIQAEYEAVSALRQSLTALESRLRKAPEAHADATSFDTDALEARLYALAQLKRKLRRTLPEILDLRTEIDENISFLDSCALDIGMYHKEEQKLAEKLKVILEELTPLRRQCAENFTKNLEQALSGLGFSKDVQVIAEFTRVKIWDDIYDEKARLLWAPNPGQAPQALDKIASGGELSRFLLALVSSRDSEENAIYIFDEVDAGIGGFTLNMVAERLKNLAQKRQMLLITHWPQLAMQGQTHFFIKKHEVKGRTFSVCKKLSSKEKQAELLRMSGGIPLSEQGFLVVPDSKK